MATAPQLVRPESISVRRRDAGGPVGPAMPQPATVLQDRDAFTLLIHGFAVTRQNAEAVYDTFRSRLVPFDTEAVNIYWPGDWGVHGLTQASYPIQRRRALDSVAKLQAFLSAELNWRVEEAFLRGTVPRPLELRIVAHSLGCLVALELLKLLDRSPRELKVSLLVLMAAAVPQYRLGDGDLGFVLRRINKVLVYRSYSDWVLALAFSLGELPHVPFPEGLRLRSAIGRNGCGRAIPNVVEEERHCGHSGYWPDRSIAAAVRKDAEGSAAASEIRSLNGRKVIGRGVRRRAVGDEL